MKFMKIAQLNDTHEGYTKGRAGAIKKLLKKMSREEFDVLLHCGDYCGGIVGNRTLNSTVLKMRDEFPDKPIVSVIGNHDYWFRGMRSKTEWDGYGHKVYKNPHLIDFYKNYATILQTFADHNVHFLDKQGPYRHKDFPGTALVGHTGWYHNPNPQAEVNCFKYLPHNLEGDTHRYMQKKAINELDYNLSLLDENDKQIVFVSHFPVINPSQIYGGDPFIAKLLQEDYNCKYFFF